MYQLICGLLFLLHKLLLTVPQECQVQWMQIEGTYLKNTVLTLSQTNYGCIKPYKQTPYQIQLNFDLQGFQSTINNIIDQKLASQKIEIKFNQFTIAQSLTYFQLIQNKLTTNYTPQNNQYIFYVNPSLPFTIQITGGFIDNVKLQNLSIDFYLYGVNGQFLYLSFPWGFSNINGSI